jgi:hypothetical protein
MPLLGGKVVDGGVYEHGLGGHGVPDECDAASFGVPPELVALASAACHGSSDCPANRYIELCLDPITGGVEPRTQVYHDLFSGDYGMFLRATFDRPMAVDALPADWYCLVPDPGLLCAATTSGLNDEVIEIRFTDSDGEMAEVPAGSYRVDLTGITSTNGVQLSGGCASFPICFIPGDVNRDGVLDRIDAQAIHFYQDQHPRDPGVPPAADLDRDGIVAVSPSDIAPGDLPWLISTQIVSEVTCTTPEVCDDCNGNLISDALEIAAGTACDWNTNGSLDLCESPADWDADGDVDLMDYAGFQRCYGGAGAGCADHFDMVGNCGMLDLVDYAVLGDNFLGPASGGSPQAMMAGGSQCDAGLESGDGSRRAAGGKTCSANSSLVRSGPASEPRLAQSTSAALSIELQPLGGGEPLDELQSSNGYELHYTTDAAGASLYLVTVQGSSATGALAFAGPATSGEWADTGNFTWINLADGGGYPTLESEPEILQLQLIIDDLGTQFAAVADSAGTVCVITLGSMSELRLDVMMALFDSEGDQITCLETTRTWPVVE